MFRWLTYIPGQKYENRGEYSNPLREKWTSAKMQSIAFFEFEAVFGKVSLEEVTDTKAQNRMGRENFRKTFWQN